MSDRVSILWRKQLSFLLVLVLEFLNTTCCINKQLLACKEWMRCRANLDLDHRILLAIFFPLDSLFRVRRRAAFEFCVAGGIPENNLSVFRMNAFFHINLCVFPVKGLQRYARGTDIQVWHSLIFDDNGSDGRKCVFFAF